MCGFRLATWQYRGTGMVVRSILALCGLHYGLVCSASDLSAQPSGDGMLLGFSLQAPNYHDRNEVGQHAAFSMILARLLGGAFDQGIPHECDLSPSVQFPDLRLSLAARSRSDTTALKQCVERIEHILANVSFDSVGFTSIVQKAANQSRPASLESGDLSRSDQTFARLRILGQQTLKELYQTDSVMQPLLTVHDRLISEGKNQSAFVNWLTRQRSSGRFGFFSAYEVETERLRQWGVALSRPSARPVLQRPTIDISTQLHIKAPNAGGRSIILAYCDGIRDPTCVDSFLRAVCFKPIDELVAVPSAQPVPDRAQLKCRSIGVQGLRGWIVAEADNETALKRFKDELLARGVGVIQRDFFEYVVLVTTK